MKGDTNICIQSKNWRALGFLFSANQSKIRIVTASLLTSRNKEGLLFLSKYHVHCGVPAGAADPKGRLPGVTLPADLLYPKD